MQANSGRSIQSAASSISNATCRSPSSRTLVLERRRGISWPCAPRVPLPHSRAASFHLSPHSLHINSLVLVLAIIPPAHFISTSIRPTLALTRSAAACRGGIAHSLVFIDRRSARHNHSPACHTLLNHWSEQPTAFRPTSRCPQTCRSCHCPDAPSLVRRSCLPGLGPSPS